MKAPLEVCCVAQVVCASEALPHRSNNATRQGRTRLICNQPVTAVSRVGAAGSMGAELMHRGTLMIIPQGRQRIRASSSARVHDMKVGTDAILNRNCQV